MNTAKLLKTITLFLMSVQVFANQNSVIPLFESGSGYYICKDKKSTIAKLSKEKQAEQIIKDWSNLSRCKGEIQYRHHYSVMEFISYPVRGVHKSSFKPLIPYLKLAKDKNHLYSQGIIIKDFDVNTLVLLNDGEVHYIKDKNQVYILPVSSDDFMINIYGKLEKIEHAHAPSFQLLGDGFAKDQARVYAQETAVEFPDAKPDLNSFEKIGHSFYFKDKNYVYRTINPAYESANQCSSEGFCQQRLIYYLGTPKFHLIPIKGADPDTFQITDRIGHEAKDKNAIELSQ